jgi:hypothetical protein
MWQCSKCGESIEDGFDVCWKCGNAWDGVADPQFQKSPHAETPAPAAVPAAVPVSTDPHSGNPIACARCNEPLHYVGRKRFHEGANWGVFGEIGELFVKREHFDVYVCPRCGRVEFFVDGIGEQFRPN